MARRSEAAGLNALLAKVSLTKAKPPVVKSGTSGLVPVAKFATGKEVFTTIDVNSPGGGHRRVISYKSTHGAQQTLSDASLSIGLSPNIDRLGKRTLGPGSKQRISAARSYAASDKKARAMASGSSMAALGLNTRPGAFGSAGALVPLSPGLSVRKRANESKRVEDLDNFDARLQVSERLHALL